MTLPVTKQGTSKGHQEVNNKKENKEVKEMNYKIKENKVITINSYNEQTAGQAGRRSRAPEWSDYKKTQLNCYDRKMSML